jgi:hypothetical protein
VASAPRLRTIARGVPLAPDADGNADERRQWARPIEPELAECWPLPPRDADLSAPAGLSAQMGEGEETEPEETEPEVGGPLIEKTLVKKTWGWFRHAGLLRRQPLD